MGNGANILRWSGIVILVLVIIILAVNIVEA